MIHYYFLLIQELVSIQDCTSWPVERCNVRTELVNKVTPETACKKVPKEKCAPA